MASINPYWVASLPFGAVQILQTLQEVPYRHVSVSVPWHRRRRQTRASKGRHSTYRGTLPPVHLQEIRAGIRAQSEGRRTKDRLQYRPPTPPASERQKSGLLARDRAGRRRRRASPASTTTPLRRETRHLDAIVDPVATPKLYLNRKPYLNHRTAGPQHDSTVCNHWRHGLVVKLGEDDGEHDPHR